MCVYAGANTERIVSRNADRLTDRPLASQVNHGQALSASWPCVRVWTLTYDRAISRIAVDQ